MNLRLIQILQFFYQFNLNIRYKPRKNYIISDILFRLASANTKKQSSKYNKLDFLYIAILVQMHDDFWLKIFTRYKNNL